MSGIDVTTTLAGACEAREEQQRQATLRKTLADAPWRRKAFGASESKATQEPVVDLLEEPPQDSIDGIGSGSEDSASEQEEELQSNNNVRLAPPPGIFAQSNASKVTPPPGVFVQSRAALPCLLGRSFCSHTSKQQEHRRGETKAPLEPPPGLFIGTRADSKASKAIATAVRDQEKPRDVIELPPDFRAPPGLEHMVDLSCYKETGATKPRNLSRAPSDDDLSTVVGSTFHSASVDDVDEISSEDETTPSHFAKPKPTAESSASSELDECVCANDACKYGVPGRFVMPMPMIPFVPAAAVHMAWRQYYGLGAMSAKYSRKQGIA